MKTFAFVAMLGALSSIDDNLPSEISIPEGEGVMMHLYSDGIKSYLENSELKGEYSVSVLVNSQEKIPNNDFLPGKILDYLTYANEYHDGENGFKQEKLQDDFFITPSIEEVGQDSEGNKKIKGKFIRVSFKASQNIDSFNITPYLINASGEQLYANYKLIIHTRAESEVKWKLAYNPISSGQFSLVKGNEYDIYMFPMLKIGYADAGFSSERERIQEYINQGYFEDVWTASELEYYSGKKVFLFSILEQSIDMFIDEVQPMNGVAKISQQLDGMISMPALKINKDVVATSTNMKVNLRLYNEDSGKEYLTKEIQVNVVDQQCETKELLQAFYVPETRRYNNSSLMEELGIGLQEKNILVPLGGRSTGFSVNFSLNWVPDLEYFASEQSEGYRVVGNTVFLDFVKNNIEEPDANYLNLIDGKLRIVYKIPGCQSKEAFVPLAEIGLLGIPSLRETEVASGEALSVSIGERITVPLEITDSDANLVGITAFLKKPSVEGVGAYFEMPMSWYSFQNNSASIFGGDSSASNNVHGKTNYSIQLPLIPYDPALYNFVKIIGGGGEDLPPIVSPGQYDLYISAYDAYGNADLIIKQIEVLENPNLQEIEPVIIVSEFGGQAPLDGYVSAEFIVTPEQAGEYMAWTVAGFPGEPDGSRAVLYSIRIFKAGADRDIELYVDNYGYGASKFHLEAGSYFIQASLGENFEQPATEFNDQKFNIFISNEYMPELELYNIPPVNYTFPM
jgi:hypothetical protein